MAKSYPCPCCGYRTLPQPPPGTWDICPVCFWEDAPAGWDRCSNRVSLRQGQANFLELGVCEPDFINDVRSPMAHEQRPPDWKPIAIQEAERQALLIQAITAAFADVRREDGVSLHQAEVIDDYGSAAEEAKARLLDTDTHWREVPDGWIAKFYSALSFLDPKGFRYYIPAYMIWAVKHHQATTSSSMDSIIYAFLTSGGLETWSEERFRILNAAQAKAVCLFLRHMVWLGEETVDAQSAQLAMEQRWGQFCDNDS